MHYIYCKGNRIVFSGDYDTKVEALRVFRDEQSGAHVKDGETLVNYMFVENAGRYAPHPLGSSEKLEDLVNDGEIILAFTSEDPFEDFNEVNVMDYVNDGTFTFIEKIMDYHHGSK